MEKWGSKINDFAKDNLITARFFTNRSDELAGGGDTIHTPSKTEMAANTKTNGAAVTLNSPTETAVDLVVNTWDEVSFAVEDGEAAIWLKSYHSQEVDARNAGYTAAAVLEDAILALVSSFTTNVIGASDHTIVDSDIRKALGIAQDTVKEDTDKGNFAFFFDTKVFWNQVAGINTYQLNTNTPTADPLMKAPAKWLYGTPVYTSSRIPTSSGSVLNFLAHRDAIHFATARLPRQNGEYVRVQSNYVPQYLSTVTTADLKYGVVMNRESYGVLIKSIIS